MKRPGQSFDGIIQELMNKSPEDETKDFIKNVMNRYTAKNTVMFSEKELEMIKES
jgi:uncharacterized membrane-anchored protein YjiN (DUF445 family)